MQVRLTITLTTRFRIVALLSWVLSQFVALLPATIILTLTKPGHSAPLCTNPNTTGGSASTHAASVDFFDLAGPNIPHNGTRAYSLTTQDGRTITATVNFTSNVSSTLLTPQTIDTRNVGTFLNSSFNAPGVRETFRSNIAGVSSTVTVDFTIGGSPAAVDVVAFDGEALSNSGGAESWTVATNGGTFETIDTYLSFAIVGEETTTVTVLGTTPTASLHGSPLLLSRDATHLTYTWTNTPTGRTGIGFAIFSPQDTGDAIAAYGNAYHQLNIVNAGCTAFAAQDPQIGSIRPDSESPSNSTNADADDLTGDDEDAFTTLGPVRLTDGTFTVNVPVENNSGSTATLGGWVDFDNSDSFEADEFQSTSVAAGFVGVTALSFPIGGVGAGLVVGTSYARLRISNNSIGFSNAAGFLNSGEVEDYTLDITEGLTVVKSVSSGPSINLGPNNLIVDR